MAMKPFCGYNFADYWSHWLSFAERSSNLPRIFHVNWFRQDQDGDFMWPGFGENLRVLRWIIDRCKGKSGVVETPIGNVPMEEAIDTEGLNLSPGTMRALLEINRAKWCEEMKTLDEYFSGYGKRLPARLQQEHARIMAALEEY